MPDDYESLDTEDKFGTSLIHPSELDRDQLVGIVETIQSLLWVDCEYDEAGNVIETVNPNKSWDNDFLDFIADIFTGAGLGPDGVGPDENIGLE